MIKNCTLLQNSDLYSQQECIVLQQNSPCKSSKYSIKVHMLNIASSGVLWARRVMGLLLVSPKIVCFGFAGNDPASPTGRSSPIFLSLCLYQLRSSPDLSLYISVSPSPTASLPLSISSSHSRSLYFSPNLSILSLSFSPLSLVLVSLGWNQERGRVKKKRGRRKKNKKGGRLCSNRRGVKLYKLSVGMSHRGES